eukprot:COSAG02_NODE_7864_length_2812_cov_1.858124_2_plen_43_part_00
MIGIEYGDGVGQTMSGADLMGIGLEVKLQPMQSMLVIYTPTA